MSERIRELPDALVLGAGGTLGEAWLRGVLGGLEAGGALDFRDCEYLIGTSAGSIVAATLAAGKRPEAGEHAAARVGPCRRAAGGDRRPRVADAPGREARRRAGPRRRPRRQGRGDARSPRWRWRRPVRPAAWPAPRSSAGRRGRRPRSTASAATSNSSAARFDGRLRIAAVDRARGKRVMFGAPDEPKATVTEAVLASCAVPWIFAPVEIGGREYVDGGVWSPTNLDAAPGRARDPRAGADPDRRARRSPRCARRARPPPATSRWRCGPRARASTPSFPIGPSLDGDRPRPDGRRPPRGGRRGRLRAGAAAVAAVSERFYGELGGVVAADLAAGGLRGGGGRDRPPARRRRATVLELGCGGGSNAFHLKDRFALTLIDLSAECSTSRARSTRSASTSRATCARCGSGAPSTRCWSTTRSTT